MTVERSPPPPRPEAMGTPPPLDSDDFDFSLQHPGAGVIAEFRLLVASVEDHAIFMLDPAGRVASWNQGAARISGYLAEEIMDQHVSRFFTAEDVDCRFPAKLLATAQTEGHVENEGWRVRADGSRFWASVSLTALRGEQGQLLGFGTVTHDLSERKQAAQAISAAQDEEGRRIAASLNDRTGPGFGALVAKLYQARKHSVGVAYQLVDDSIALAEFLFREMRTVSDHAHPPGLQTNGLLITLRSYLEGFAKHNRVLVEMDLPRQLERLPDSSEAALYRVAQECLTSLLYRSGSSRAWVCLTVKGGCLTLQIRDSSGRLSPEALAEAKAGSGELGVTVAGVRERMKLLGGGARIESNSSGTTVSATVPVKEPRRRSAPPAWPPA